MRIIIGKVDKVKDAKKGIITPKISGKSIDSEAYPIQYESEIKENDSIALLSIDGLLHTSFFYFKIKEDDFVRLEYNNNTILLKDNSIEITSQNSINIKANSGGINITATAGETKISGKPVKIQGAPGVPNLQGGFCAVPNCLFTGAPHTTDTIMTP